MESFFEGMGCNGIVRVELADIGALGIVDMLEGAADRVF